MNKQRLAIVNAFVPTGTHDVFVGYAKAFRLLGYHTDTILGHLTYRDWSEYYRFFAIVNGAPGFSYTQETIVKSASLNLVLKVMESDPDVLIIIDGSSIHKDAWEWFRRLGIKTIVVNTESPYQDKFITHINELVFKSFTNEFTTSERTGIEYLPVGYDSEAHHPMMVDTSYRKDVIFIGSGFPERVEILNGVNWEGVDFEFYGYYPINEKHKLAEYYKGTNIPNAETALYYNGSKISLNLNRVSVDYDGSASVPEAASLSPRAYEIAACGGFMISQYRPEIESIFGDLVPTFNTSEELDDLIRYWLDKDRDDERREIGDELASIVRPHSYIERAKHILEVLSTL